MLDINPGLILWTIITFIIVVLILRAVAWKPLLGALTAREQQIRSSLQHAEQAQQDAERLLEGPRVRLVQVTVGETLGDLVEIKGGLKEGERVVLKPPAGLGDGSRVKVKE